MADGTVEIRSANVGIFDAGADLSGNQYQLVKLSSGAIVLAGDGEDAIGVLLNKPKQGQPAEVIAINSGWTVPVKLGATLAADATFASDASGKAKAPATGDAILGVIQQGGDADELGQAWLVPPSRLAP